VLDGSKLINKIAGKVDSHYPNVPKLVPKISINKLFDRSCLGWVDACSLVRSPLQTIIESSLNIEVQYEKILARYACFFNLGSRGIS